MSLSLPPGPAYADFTEDVTAATREELAGCTCGLRRAYGVCDDGRVVSTMAYTYYSLPQSQPGRGRGLPDQVGWSASLKKRRQKFYLSLGAGLRAIGCRTPPVSLSLPPGPAYEDFAEDVTAAAREELVGCACGLRRANGARDDGHVVSTMAYKYYS